MAKMQEIRARALQRIVDQRQNREEWRELVKSWRRTREENQARAKRLGRSKST